MTANRISHVNNNPTIHAMIPARIGSTRFKMKNLAILGGKPMISYAIIAAIQSKQFSRVIVNSDSEIFLGIAEEYGAEFFLRPKNLGGSTTQSDDVVENFVNEYPSDIVVWLNPIAPLQTTEDIQNTISYFLANNLDSLFSVKKEQIQCVFRDNPVNFDPQEKFDLTQDLEPIYPFAPFIMMWRTESFLQSIRENGSAFFCGKVGYFPVSRLSSITIKYEEDFRLAEALIQSNLKGQKAIQYYKK